MNSSSDTNIGADVSSSRNKERIVWIDILRGAMMFFVVYGHATARGDVKRLIFSFHMPIFFIISGMTFSFNRVTDPGKYLLKKLKGLVLPYFLLNLYVSPLFFWNMQVGMIKETSVPQLIKGILISNVDVYPMASNTTWFITCLFVTDMIFFIFRTLFKSDALLVFSLVTFTSMFYALGGISHRGGGIWHWQTAVTAVIFYCMGYFFMNNIGRIKSFMLENKARAVLISLLMSADWFMLAYRNSTVSMVNDSYKNVLFFYLSATAASLAFVILIILLSENKVFLKLSYPIKLIGMSTLPYIAFHVPILKLMKHYFPLFAAQYEPGRLLAAVIIYAAFLPFALLIKQLLPTGKLFRKKPALDTQH